MLKLGIIGYGKMGKLIHGLAEKRVFEVVNIVDVDRGGVGKGADVYIDFSVHYAVLNNITSCSSLGIPLVIGTTGWENDREKAKQIVEESKNRVIYSSNFSLGVNLFWQVVSVATKLFGAFPEEYDVMVHELHHKNKVDSPSGTAKELARIITELHPKKKKLCVDALNRKIEPEELHVTSTRGGSIPGTHSVVFDGDSDTIELTHTARSREGFARGALLAAEKIRNLPPGFYQFKDILGRPEFR